MIDKKQLLSGLDTVRDALTSAIEFLERDAPGHVQRFGELLHDNAEKLQLVRPRRRFGLGTAMTLLGVAALAVVLTPTIRARMSA